MCFRRYRATVADVPPTYRDKLECEGGRKYGLITNDFVPDIRFPGYCGGGDSPASPRDLATFLAHSPLQER